MRVFLYLLTILVFAAPAVAQEQAAAKSCVPVATVGGKDICSDEITLGPKARANLDAYAEKNGQDADQSALNIQHANLFAKIWETALIQKFGAEALEPTEKEKTAFLKLYRNAVKQQHTFDKELADLIKSQLAKYEYPQDVYQKLNRLGAQKEQAIVMFEKRKDMPKEMQEKIEKGEQEMAHGMVKGWKVKKLLYETYGGRLAFVDTELEPVDAYKQFLAEIRKEGNAVIHDDAYQNVFKTMDAYIDKTKTFVEEGTPEIKDYFAAPGWVYSAGVNKKVFEQLKKSILAMPEAGIAKPIGEASAETPAADAKKE